MGFEIHTEISALAVFVQGLLSFFSPCVLPILPLYLGYLSGGAVLKEGSPAGSQRKTMVNTCFFVVGISCAFFLLGLGASAAGRFLTSGQEIFSVAGGVVVILFGLYQLGVFGNIRFLGRERRVSLPLERLTMSPVTALVMGFTFSFAWTPCVGPALAGVLLMTASEGGQTQGMVLIGVYTLGFVLPFLAAGFFTTSVLALFRKHRSIVRWTVKAGGVVMIVMGLLMISGKAGQISGSLAENSAAESQAAGEAGGAGEAAGAGEEADAARGNAGTAGESGAAAGGASGAGENGDGAGEASGAGESGDGAGEASGTGENGDAAGEASGAAERQLPDALDFTLTDQFGNTHSLEDYKGKTIFLNFRATWCGPCRAEMPDIQTLYDTYSQEGDDALVVLGVAAPLMGREGSQEEIEGFLSENGYTYPVLMDTEGALMNGYGITAFPTTFMITREGKVYGYVAGQLNLEIMEDIIRQTMEGAAAE